MAWGLKFSRDSGVLLFGASPDDIGSMNELNCIVFARGMYYMYCILTVSCLVARSRHVHRGVTGTLT